ncbi:hypothetical protein HBA55_10165 [Pseudomaricurvus alkylphenolicus]|uniref:hypothetical protein n=1 Tax=Pseudomaricurvus alkylphenolicus TaxID=1306991 RepID=UPI001421326F|nr:hypothetical protein [Pseudomaricurvus alkylphenolicus]NIB39952.1 hypothetical protein [Pseudomaricurvus alkylphenolicus]
MSKWCNPDGIRTILVALIALLAVAPPVSVADDPVSGHTRDSILVLAGQSVRATLDYYQSPALPRPAGFSDYISYDVGTPYLALAPDYPAIYRGNDGLKTATNWGSGEQCVACNLARPEFSNAIINIGMYLAGPRYDDGSLCSARPDCNTQKMVRGEMDSQLRELADWLTEYRSHRVLLRVGYEFDGSWNGYDPNQFIAAYKYIHRFLNRAGVSNVEFVWHSFGYASEETLQRYFPEPDATSERYVDWVGYSYFALDSDTVGANELAFARRKNLPVFLGEVAPHTGDCQRQIDLAKNTALGKQWIDSFFAYLEKHRDVIGGFAYINENWSDKTYAPMWDDQQDHNCGGFFARSNSRLQDNATLEAYWASYVRRPMFLNAQ